MTREVVGTKIGATNGSFLVIGTVSVVVEMVVVVVVVVGAVAVVVVVVVVVVLAVEELVGVVVTIPVTVAVVGQSKTTQNISLVALKWLDVRL